ncbi:hypothetical protein [Paraburkholderia sp.]|nr:hypothetical protein [Paraburkholderia sp.]
MFGGLHGQFRLIGAIGQEIDQLEKQKSGWHKRKSFDDASAPVRRII